MSDTLKLDTLDTSTLDTFELDMRPDSDTLTDGAIIGAAADARVSRVAGNGSRSAFQSHDARAWTMSGNVD
jgi:hypothetical protein